MIKSFVEYLVQETNGNDQIVFLTGDLGYQSAGRLEAGFGERFINAGVAEQNMMNVAAGMASEGFKVYVYSIAPFLIYRAYEQIKLNIASRDLDVKLLANGGGYGYGIMGPTHHALNDLALMNGLENIVAKIPACEQDVKKMVTESLIFAGPEYIRLGLNDQCVNKTYSNGIGIVRTNEVAKATVVTLGPLVNVALNLDVDHFTCYQFPLKSLPIEFINSVKKTGKLIVVEEHTADGGVGEKILALIQKETLSFEFIHHFANHYFSGFGDQSFHQEQNKLTRNAILEQL